MDPLLQNTMILLAIIYPLHVVAYPTGAVPVACADMHPSHNSSTAQTSTPPYSLTLSKKTYSGGDKITVTLKNTTAEPIEGFLIQARDGSNTTALGTFEISGSDKQLLTCTTAASAVTHTSDSEKAVVMVTWVAPNANYTNIQFRATVVRNFSTFWEGISSEKLTYSGAIYLDPSLSQMFLGLTALIVALHTL